MAGESKTSLSVLKVLAVLSQAAVVIAGAMGIFRSPFSFSDFLVSIYAILFGVVAILAVLYEPKGVYAVFGLLRSHSGRGLFEIFLGSLLISLGQKYTYSLVFGIVAVVVGVIHIAAGMTVLDGSSSVPPQKYVPIVDNEKENLKSSESDGEYREV